MASDADYASLLRRVEEREAIARDEILWALNEMDVLGMVIAPDRVELALIYVPGFDNPDETEPWNQDLGDGLFERVMATRRVILKRLGSRLQDAAAKQHQKFLLENPNYGIF